MVDELGVPLHASFASKKLLYVHVHVHYLSVLQQKTNTLVLGPHIFSRIYYILYALCFLFLVLGSTCRLHHVGFAGNAVKF